MKEKRSDIPCVVADFRERPSEVPALLGELGFRVEFEQLATGDYRISNRLLVERKTLVDFAASIIDGRIFRQARRMAMSSQVPLLILEGTAESLQSCRMSRESLQGALVSLTLVYAIPVLRAFEPTETARLMKYAFRQTALGRGRPVRLGRCRARARQRMQLGVLQSLPGVGPVRSRALLEKFRSVGAVIGAEVEELCEVEGIGSHTANLMRWLLG